MKPLHWRAPLQFQHEPKFASIRLLVVLVALSLAFGLLPVPFHAPVWKVAYGSGFTARTWGAANTDYGISIATGKEEDIYVSGIFDLGTSASTRQDLILLKWSNDGSLKWKRAVDVDSRADSGDRVQVAPDGGVVVAGNNSDGIVGLADTLLMKFNARGDLLWARDWGLQWSPVQGLVIDGTGSIYVSGGTTAGPPPYNSLLHKFGANGNHFYSKALDTGEDDVGNALALDPTGSYLYLSGQSASGFPKKTFLYKVGTAGNIVWVRRWDGALFEQNSDVVVDKAGNVYVVGFFNNLGLYDPLDIYVLKFDPNGNLLWARGWDSGANEYAGRAALDKAGNVYVTGLTNKLGGYGVLLLQFSPTGTLLLSQVWQGTSDANGIDVTVAGNNVLITGFAPNNQGAWQNIAGTTSTLGSSVVALSSATYDLTGTFFTPSTTPYVPFGVENTGGGGNDALLLRFLAKP